ncbi:MAG: sugar phosphate isomerase/epimerase [Clostridia bacterium]|nr:sugar phosphate isomerase/epimerase [Clostridia bacterium]
MKLSVETLRIRDYFDDKTAVRMIKEAGFDAYDYSACVSKGEKYMLGDDYLTRAHELREYADALGIPCNQAHAPFEGVFLDAGDLNENNPYFLAKVRSIEFASILGARTIVIHAQKPPSEDIDLIEANRRFYLSLLPYAERFGIDISVENLFYGSSPSGRALPLFGDPKLHRSFIESLGSDRFNACLDVGHTYLTGFDPADSVRVLGKDHLKCLHVHDNLGMKDLHMIPYTAGIDWSAFTDAIADSGYAGDLTLELVGCVGRMPKDLCADILRFSAAVGRYLISEIERKTGKNV